MLLISAATNLSDALAREWELLRQGPGITMHGARHALCTGSTAIVPHSCFFSYLLAALEEAAALLAEAQVTLASIFLSPPHHHHPPMALQFFTFLLLWHIGV